MRVTVIGAGAVGGALAALLDRAGHEVSVTARGDHAVAITESGLTLDGGFGAHRAGVAVVARTPADTRLVIVATKANDTAAALAGVDVPSGCPVMVLQNGLGGDELVRSLLPSSPVGVGLALFAASLTAPGRVTVTAAAPLVIGGDARAVAVALPVLRAALPERVDVSADIRGAQWTKLVINQVNALPAITGLSVQQTVADDRLRRVLGAAMAETVAVGAALGVSWQAIGPVDTAALRPLQAPGAAGVAAGEELARMLARGMGDVPNPASMLQSIRRGRVTEVDQINGAVAAAGRATGVATPVSDALIALVHEVERTATFVTPADAATRVSTTQD